MGTRDWESIFREWSKPSSETEQEKCENAERMVRAALRESPKLNKRTLDVFAQGSYRNNTNVRQDSDVDICVVCRDVVFTDLSLAGGATNKSLGFVDASYEYAQFKNEVGEALITKFGESTVTRGNKAFDVHANTYRVDADVVPCFEHRRYYLNSYGQPYFVTGTELHTDKGDRIINWPNQHYESGVSKNNTTNKRFKYITRALKRLRNEMVGYGIAIAQPVPSFLIECLVWNTPNQNFGYSQYLDDVRNVLTYAYSGTSSDDRCQNWLEVSELKYLFRYSQPWTREQANIFILGAMLYTGLQQK